MGRTIRQARMAVAPSPYAKQYSRRRCTRGQAAVETSTGQVVQQQGSDQSSGVATVSNQTMTHEQQHALASSVSQLLVPEISQQISQAIATLASSWRYRSNNMALHFAARRLNNFAAWLCIQLGGAYVK